MDIWGSGCAVLPNEDILVLGSGNPDFYRSSAIFNARENTWLVGFFGESLIWANSNTSSDRKKWCITINSVDSFSNLGNGMVQMPFLGKLDINGVKNRQIRYEWMLRFC